MADDLDPEEQELLRKHREKKTQAAKAADADKRAWLRNQDGSEADVPYEKARGWLQKNFGIDLDAEPVQEEPEAESDEKPKVRAFNSASRRRVS